MNEPQELRSIDELFRNAFNNLPDTPAESGWDTPSDQVWQHVRENIKPPHTGWSLQSIMLLAGFAVTLTVGLYFAFSSPKKVDVTPVSQSAPTVVTTVESPEKTAAELPATVESTAKSPAKAIAPRIPRSTTENLEQEQTTTLQVPVNSNSERPRSGGAAPLPGSKSDVKPNTTEERKAEHAKQLTKRWKTPLQLLPVPRTKKANN